MKVISRYLSYLALLLVCGQSTLVQAKSAGTLSVQGRAPVATGVAVNGPAAPLVGDSLQGTYTFGDLDLDSEQGTVLRWLDSSDVVLASGTNNYVLSETERGKRVRFGVKPATDPALTDPSEGVEALSSPSAVVQGRPDAAKSTFIIDKSTIVADGADRAVLTLMLKDDAGTPVTGVADRVSLAYSGIVPPDFILLSEFDKGNGIYEYLLTGTKAGGATLTPQLDGGDLSTTPATLQVMLTVNPATAVVSALVTTTNNQPADNVSEATLTATVLDVDGNPMSGVTVSWQRTGGLGTLSASTSTTNASGQATVRVKSATAVTATTVLAKVSANTADTGKSANATFVFLPTPAPFIKPDATRRDWSQADSYCKGLVPAARLPTREELKTLFVVKTSAGSNYELCDKYGWPLGGGRCSGIYDFYWTTEAVGSGSGHHSVNMNNGDSSPLADSNGLQVTCLTRNPATAVVSTLVTTTDNKPADNVSEDMLTATVLDVDGNPMSGVTVSWQRTGGSGTLSASTSTTNASGQATVGVKSADAVSATTVLAKVSANTADTGKSAIASFVFLSTPTPFIKPDTAQRDWSQADAYCKGLVPAARLPTRAELQKRFVDGTSATTIGQGNYEICDRYGWPLGSGRCGGTSDIYWTTESYSVSHYGVNMYNGNSSILADSNGLQVTCLTRNPATAVVSTLVTTTNNQPADNVSEATLTATVLDVDGNPMSGVTVSWLRTGGLGTLSASTSTTNASGQATVRVKSATAVTATTVLAKVSANTADTGKSAIASFVFLSTPTPFIKPDTVKRGWSQADAYCKGLVPAARLPTSAELQTLFVDTRSGGGGYELCDKYGWPLGGGHCGGNSSYYWTSATLSSGHLLVDMSYGSVTDNTDAFLGQVACVR